MDFFGIGIVGDAIDRDVDGLAVLQGDVDQSTGHLNDLDKKSVQGEGMIEGAQVRKAQSLTKYR